MDHLRFETHYMDNAVFDLVDVLKEAVEELTPHFDEFDTLVGTGFSGALVIPALALKLGKDFVLIRKEDDDSHHGGGELVGRLGRRWIFVDDFSATGQTRRRVTQKIEETAKINGFETTHVANYFYEQMVHYWPVNQWENLPRPGSLKEKLRAGTLPRGKRRVDSEGFPEGCVESFVVKTELIRQGFKDSSSFSIELGDNELITDDPLDYGPPNSYTIQNGKVVYTIQDD